MKIGNPADKRSLAPVDGQAAPAKGTDKAQGAKGADPSAKVKLSNTAEALRSTADNAEFDAGKVAAVEKAIADGTFKVNAEVIADKLISNAQELLGKVQR